MRDSKQTNKTGMSEFLLPLLFLIVTVGLYIPSSLFLGNINEFSVDFVQILPLILLPCAILLAIGLLVALLARRSRRASDIYIDLIFGGTLAVYVQGNFLNSTLKQLNGTEMIWDNGSLPAILSIAAWTLCLILPHVIRVVSAKIETMISKYGSALLTAMQVVSLVVMLLTTTRTVSNDFAITKKDEFVLSSDKNVVVFVVDTLDAQWAESYILSESAYTEALKDFTYFDNVVSCGAPTMLGMRMMLTGKIYNPDELLSDYLAHAYDDSTLFSDLQANGYSARLYTLQTYLTGADTEHIDNAVTDRGYKVAARKKFIRDMYTLTAYNGAPYPLKKYFMLYSAELTNNATLADARDDNVLLEDPEFYQDFLSQGLTVRDGKNAFVLYHLFGAHGPYSMNEEALRVDASETSLPQQIHGSIKIVLDYIDEMKRLGVYEDSTIIITADHGGVALYQNPAVFVKRPGTQEALATNSAPLTFLNLRASFVEHIVPDYRETYGLGMFDVAEDADVGYRDHTFDSILYTNVYQDAEPIKGTYLRFKIGDPARDNELIVQSDLSNPYTLGTTVPMCGEEATNSFRTIGFSGIETSYRWTDGDHAVIPLKLVGSYEDLEFSMNYKAFNGQQRLKLYANEHLVYDGTLQSGTLDGVMIPGTCVQDDHLELRFELPDAISPEELGQSADTRKLGISLESFTLNSSSETVFSQ